MSFGYNTFQKSKAVASDVEVPNFSLSQPLRKCVKESLEPSHPLESSEKLHLASMHQMNMNMLRNVQGIHAPLRISMELKAFQNVGRLPFLPSSNLSADIISGRDDYLDFSDILYPTDVHERMNQPYAVMEQKH